MGYTEALSFDRNAAIRPEFESRNFVGNASKEPIDFNKVFKEKYAEGIEALEATHETSEAEDNSTFFAGASMDMFGVMLQISEPAFPEELDSAISFDEISELDDITETVAAKKAEEAAYDRFRGFDELSDAMSEEESEEDDLSMFSDLEEII